MNNKTLKRISDASFCFKYETNFQFRNYLIITLIILFISIKLRKKQK